MANLQADRLTRIGRKQYVISSTARSSERAPLFRASTTDLIPAATTASGGVSSGNRRAGRTATRDAGTRVRKARFPAVSPSTPVLPTCYALGRRILRMSTVGVNSYSSRVKGWDLPARCHVRGHAVEVRRAALGPQLDKRRADRQPVVRAQGRPPSRARGPPPRARLSSIGAFWLVA
jgi:hypothetical protein